MDFLSLWMSKEVGDRLDNLAIASAAEKADFVDLPRATLRVRKHSRVVAPVPYKWDRVDLPPHILKSKA